MALGSHLERSCREIASVLEECVTALLEYGIEEEVCLFVACGTGWPQTGKTWNNQGFL